MSNTEIIHCKPSSLTKADVNTNQIPCWELNFQHIYPRWLENKDGRYEHLYGGSWIFREAMRHPGTLITYIHQEGRYIYERNALFDVETSIMHTNYAGCPNMNSHHLGKTCGVCGAKG